MNVSHKNIFEINTAIFLNRLSEKYQRSIALLTIPDEEWEYIRDLGFKYVWLMGVWERSIGSKKCALEDIELRKKYDQALPGWKDEDVIGSPYAIYSYSPDSRFGEKGDIAKLKAKLNKMGLRLILDFVVNHVALDHPWTVSHPDRFVYTDEIPRVDTDLFFRTKSNRYIAYGRDPNYPGWADTAQLNLFSEDLRTAQIEEILMISQVADGVRCDMAMLALNHVFLKTWEKFINSEMQPQEEFWRRAISEAKKVFPNFIFVAESYWNLEGELQQNGFDFTYDKILYDRLRYSDPVHIKEYLMTDDSVQSKSVHFIENHDEERCAVSFGPQRSKAAAVVIETIPGMSMFLQGQFEGNAIKAPVQLARVNREETDDKLKDFYEKLLSFSKGLNFRNGQWGRLETDKAGEDNHGNANLLCWHWYSNDNQCIIIINYSSAPSQGRVHIPLLNNNKKNTVFLDIIKEVEYIRDTREINNSGLYIDLEAWDYHLLIRK